MSTIKRFAFQITPITGPKFEIVRWGDNAINVHSEVLRLYGRLALDILPLGGIVQPVKPQIGIKGL